MASKKKFYAVKNGRKVGIYKTWADCQRQIHGYPGALFRGFTELSDAQAYLGDCQPIAAGNPVEPGCCCIYVDGSYFHGRYSWGMAVYRDGELIHTANGVGKSVDAAKLHNVAGEVEAAIQAVRWAVAQKLEKVILYHDYIGISEWAEGRWKTNTAMTTAYAAFMADYIGWVRFQKVAGHTGVAGNELADRLAKKALEDAVDDFDQSGDSLCKREKH